MTNDDIVFMKNFVVMVKHNLRKDYNIVTDSYDRKIEVLFENGKSLSEVIKIIAKDWKKRQWKK